VAFGDSASCGGQHERARGCADPKELRCVPPAAHRPVREI
jgi:hypothetical protein